MEYPKLTEVAETSGKIIVLIAALNCIFLLIFMISGNPVPGGTFTELIQATIRVLAGIGVGLLIAVAAYEFFRNRHRIVPHI